MTNTRTLLGVFAHPDDESFGPGGTLARYAAEGVHVHVIIATDGDAGSVTESHRNQTERTLAQVRSEELARAAVELGVTSIWNLPYRDSGMRGSSDNEHPRALVQQPIHRLLAELIDYVRRLKPQVVITHDPYGGYGHPDHIRCCEVVTAAFYAAGQRNVLNAARNGSVLPPHAPQKLYYSSFDKRILRWVVKFMQLTGRNPRQVGRNQDVDLVQIAAWETPIHARIDVGSYLDCKERASRAHASQYSGGPSTLRALPGPLRRRLSRYENYTRAFPAPSAYQEPDLFHNVIWQN
ncbi:MAG: GlcNAc-PI de-N-acetylase [Caldilineaceae bacterium SB0668_bin_21]|nr:GlcNAc-PI de-N-acetylase [Caldilineaceae bacterium SB0668_bin_21]MYC22752.1 GlcNAc-PI de-N-acetylase [Caldilineaceae bacterium SB0662_bin_25]